MRVIRRKGFGARVEVAGTPPDRKRPTLPAAAIEEISRTLEEPAAVILARLLERRIGRGGGLRDPRPGFSRDRYHTFAVDRYVEGWIKKQADERGLARGAFIGMLLEAATEMTADDLDDLLAGDRS